MEVERQDVLRVQYVLVPGVAREEPPRSSDRQGPSGYIPSYAACSSAVRTTRGPPLRCGSTAYRPRGIVAGAPRRPGKPDTRKPEDRRTGAPERLSA